MPGNRVELLFLGDSRQAQRAVGQLQKALGEVESKTARTSREMQAWGSKLTRGVTLPIAAVGAGFLAAGNQVDQAAATIRRGTGATGAALDGLVGEMEDVARRVPAAIGDAGKAIADLNTRTGQTGDALEELAAAELNLARIAGEDLNTVIQGTTRVFGDWGIEAANQVDTLDQLWRVSQATGAGIGSLTAQLVQYGAPLRQLGFQFLESATLLGAFEREGVNAELVMGSLRIALGKMAREGEPAVDTFRKVVAQIEEAGSASEANALALELFGARAGPDMAAAIREGRFEIDELLASLQSSSETIEAAAEESRTLGESLTLLKNQAILAAAPLGRELVGALQSAMPLMEGAFGLLAHGASVFASLPPVVQGSTIALVGLAAMAGPMLTLGGKMLGLVGRAREMHTAMATLRALGGKTTPSFAAMAGAVGGVTLAIGLAVTAYSLWYSAQQKQKQQVEELTATLDDNTAAITENTREHVLNKLAKEGHLDRAKALGISLGDVADAALGEQAALDRVIPLLNQAAQLTGNWTQEDVDLKNKAIALRGAILDVAQATEEATRQKRLNLEAAAEQKGEVLDVTHAIQGLTPEMAGWSAAVKRGEEASRGAAAASGDHAGALGEQGSAADETETEIEELTSALKTYTQFLEGQINPVLGAARAQQSYQESLEKLKETEADEAATAEDLADAQRDVADKRLDVIGALTAMTDENNNLVVSTEQVSEALGRMQLPPAVRDRILADLNGVLRLLVDLERSDPDIVVNVDTSEALRRLRELNAQLRAAGATGIRVDEHGNVRTEPNVAPPPVAPSTTTLTDRTAQSTPTNIEINLHNPVPETTEKMTADAARVANLMLHGVQ